MLDEVREQDEGVYFLRRVVEGKYTSPIMLLGDEGVGRRYSVLQAAQEMFCSDERASRCSCANCYQLAEGIHPDLMVVTPDNGEVKVAAIRDLVVSARSYPTTAPVKVFCIDGADKMTLASANALLKTLEEPPPSARFFLLAETASKVIPTIRSRCGLVQYRRLSTEFIKSVLRKSDDDDERVSVIARMSEGSLGLAVNYLGSGRLALRDKVLNLLRLSFDENLSSLFSSIDGIEKELPLALKFLEQLVHDVILVRDHSSGVIHMDVAEDIGKMQERGTQVNWHRMLDDVRDLRERIRTRIFLPFHVKHLFIQTFWRRDG
jgi:DNA polymerase-3 subunit delta'